jgi:hypothetical protein
MAITPKVGKPKVGEPVTFTTRCSVCGTKIKVDDAYTIGALGDAEPVCLDCFQLLQGV